MSAQEQVDITFRSDSSQTLQAMNAIAAGFGRIAQAGQKAQVGAQSLFDFTGGSIAKMTMQVLGIGSALQAVHTVGRLVMAEYNNFLEKNRAAADTQVSFADAQRRFAGQLDPKTNLHQISQQLLGVAKGTGVPSGVLGEVFAEALSTKISGRAVSDQQVLAAVKTAAQYRPGPRARMDELSFLAQGIVMLQRSGIVQNEEQAMGWIQQLERGSRGKDITSLVKYQLPGIVQAISFGEIEGASPKMVAAMGLALGAAGEDPHSRRARTAQINLLKQLKVGFAQQGKQFRTADEMIAFALSDAPQAQGLVSQLLGPLYTGNLDLPADRMGPEMQAAVRRLGGMDIDLKADAPMFMPMVQLLQRRSTSGRPTQAFSYFNALMQDLTEPTDPRNVEMFRTRQKEIDASSFQTAARIERAVVGTADSIRLQNIRGGATGAMREVRTMLRDAGLSNIAQEFVEKRFDIESAMADQPSEVVEAGIRAAGAGRVKQKVWLGAGPRLGERMPLTLQEKGINQSIDELTTALRDLQKQLEGEQKIKVEQGGEHIRGTIAAEKAGQ